MHTATDAVQTYITGLPFTTITSNLLQVQCDSTTVFPISANCYIGNPWLLIRAAGNTDIPSTSFVGKTFTITGTYIVA